MPRLTRLAHTGWQFQSGDSTDSPVSVHQARGLRVPAPPNYAPLATKETEAQKEMSSKLYPDLCHPAWQPQDLSSYCARTIAQMILLWKSSALGVNRPGWRGGGGEVIHRPLCQPFQEYTGLLVPPEPNAREGETPW